MIMKILIADADVLFLALCRHSFTSEGYQLETTATGLDCLARLREGQPDLLILDWSLPWGGGDGVLAHMRQEVLLPRIPVILTLPASVPELPDDLLESPVVACVRKPIRTRRLIEQVQHIEAVVHAREPG